MALSRSKYSEIPKDAVVLTEKEAVIYQLKLLKNWPNSWDVFSFKYGSVLLSVAGALTGIYLNSHYRRKLKLRDWGKLSTYLPICVLPSVLTYATHAEVVISDLVLNKTKCPVCVEMRSSALQATLGCLLPALLAPISSFSMSHKYGTYDIPYLHKEPKKVFELYQKLTKPIGNILFAIFIGHALLGTVVCYAEAKSVSTVRLKLIEQELESENEIFQ